ASTGGRLWRTHGAPRTQRWLVGGCWTERMPTSRGSLTPSEDPEPRGCCESCTLFRSLVTCEPSVRAASGCWACCRQGRYKRRRRCKPTGTRLRRPALGILSTRQVIGRAGVTVCRPSAALGRRTVTASIAHVHDAS